MAPAEPPVQGLPSLPDAAAPDIGARLHRARRDRGLTLAEVAQGAGLTRSFLSRLEHDDTAASVASLMRICAVLGIRVASLFEPQAGQPAERHEVRRPACFGGSGVVDYVLTPADERRAQVFETHLEPGASAGDELWSSDGELTVAYVSHGAFEIVFAGRSVRLRRGEVLAFDPREPHTWRNPSSARRAVVVLVDVPPMF